MSSHVVVIATDLRRATIKVTPGTYLTDVLQQACKKLNLSSDKYLMRHKQKQVDLSVPFRTAGLSPGAKLELVQKSNTPSVVQVALQIPQPEAREIPGGRLIKKFPSDLTLWKLLRQFESGDASAGRNINITARGVAKMADAGTGTGSGQLYYETPVLNIMGREFSTFVDFQKTLSQLGYNSGSVLVRMEYRTTDKTLYEAMEQIAQFFKEVESEEKTKEAPASSTDESKAPEPTATTQEAASADTPMADAQPEASQGPAPIHASQEPSTLESTKNSNTSGDKDPYEPVNVFLAPSGQTPAAALTPVSETDFTPSIAHAQLHQARLQENSKNRRLLSDRELEEKAAAEQAKIAAVKSVLVKVRFPDNTSSEWQIGTEETGGFLYEAVRHVMSSSGQPFRLVLPGGNGLIKDDTSPKNTLIKGYKLSGRVLMNLLWDDSVKPEVRKMPFLKTNIARQGQAVKVPDLPKATPESSSSKPVLEPKKEEKSSGDGAGKKMPKWFKMGGKK